MPVRAAWLPADTTDASSPRFVACGYQRIHVGDTQGGQTGSFFLPEPLKERAMKKDAWRFWLTGGVAAVLAAASQTQAASDSSRISRSSRYSAAETAKRLERLARKRGMAVFARLISPQRHHPAAPGSAPALLLVLGTDEAHTPVLQVEPDAALDLPLIVRIEEHDGNTSVVFSESIRISEYADLPGDVLEQVAALPELVDAAVS
jgi:uncharacterized protein (DUF302 family)